MVVGRAWATISLVLTLMVVVTTPAQAEIKTLEDAFALAYANNAALSAERAIVRQTDEKVPQASAAWRPTVEIDASQGISHCQGTQQRGKFPGTTGSGVCGTVSIPPTFAGSSNLSPETYGLTITQPLYRGGLGPAHSQALDLVAGERARLESTEQKILLAVVSDYMDIVLAQAQLRLYDKDVDVVRHQWSLAREQARVGEVTDADVKQAEAALARAIAQREIAAGKIKQAAAALAHDTGALPGALAPPVKSPQLPDSRAIAVEIAARHNPDVVAAKFDELASKEDIRVVRGALLPSFSLQASINRAKETGRAGLQEDQASLIAQLKVPLYDGGDTYSRTREAQEKAAERGSTLEDARLTAMQLAAQSWDAMTSAKASSLALRNEIDADAAALDSVQHEQAVGARTVQDVLAAEELLLTARVGLEQSQHDALVAAYGVRAATGQLTMAALAQPVHLYDPDVHFRSVRDKWYGFGADDGTAVPVSVQGTRHLLPLRPAAVPSPADVLMFDTTAVAMPAGSGSASTPETPPRIIRVAGPAPVMPSVAPTDFDHSSDPPPTPDKWMDSSHE